MSALQFVDIDMWERSPFGGAGSGSPGRRAALRILVHGINYAPELTGIGKYTGEFCEWLAHRGHEVRVITAPPYYPAWQVGTGYKSHAYARERLNGVDVYRCPLWVPRRPSGMRRVLHLASFALSSAPLVALQGGWRPHLTVAIEPTLLNAAPALMLARLSRGKAWLHVQDLEVDAAFSLGLLPQALSRPVFALERQLLRGFDRVSTISESMQERLIAKGVDAGRCVQFPNWVDCDLIHPQAEAGSLREALAIPANARVALYSGNMGEKQGLEIILDAARILAQEPSLFFVMCGEGGARSRFEERARGMPNLRWLPLQPLERLNELLNLADIHLLPQRADAADLVMPSKLTGMLASGRPVVATARPGTELARVAGAAGLVTPPGDAESFAAAILALKKDGAARRKFGKAARQYAERTLAREAVLARFEEEILRCVDERPLPLAATLKSGGR